MKIIFFILLITPFLGISPSYANCAKSNLSSNMCAGFGYCTYYPLGKEDEECGKPWNLPKNWVAVDTDCLSNTKTEGTFSCLGKGKIKIVICGKSNCYKCLCQ